jgi:2'-5' RNA ligase
MFRLFVAVPVPPLLTLQLQALQSGLPGAQWLPPESFHLTLTFIGEVNNAAAEDIDETLSRLYAPAGLVSVGGLGHFGSGDHARTLWAGVAAEPALLHLQSKITSALARTGIVPEKRRYTPHISLARLHRQPLDSVMRWCALNEPFRADDLPFDHFGLYSSHRSGSGPLYRLEARYPLAGGGLADLQQDAADA